METYYIKARKRNTTVADVYAAGDTSLDRIGTIQRRDGLWWTKDELAFDAPKGACLDVARRHFAIEPGKNNPNVDLIYRSR